MNSDMGVVLASELTPGTYLCLRTRSPLGFLVRLFCRPSPYDHAILVTESGECLQATVRGVKRTPLSAFAGCLAVANSGETIWSDDRAAIVAKALSYAGDEYAFALLPVIGLRKLGFRWRWLARVCQAKDRDAVFCSELVALAGAAGNRDWLAGEPSAATVRPDELAKRSPFMRTVIWGE